ncbi:MAG TPA: pimeloyl-ACP methyl ester esterase BioH [Rhodanobacteraceae bacterium]
MSKLFIQTEGRGDIPLVLLHGWALHGGAFAPLVAALRERCTLYLVDLPGHGRSAASTVSLAPAECARAIVDQVPPAAWLGWSLGGLYALQAALDFPERVLGLAMLCSSACLAQRSDWKPAMTHATLRAFGRNFCADYASAVRSFLELEAFGNDAARADLGKLRIDAFTRWPPRQRALTTGLEAIERADLRARLPAMQPPSAWIAGRRDRMVPWQAMQWCAQHCGGTFTRIEGGGHAPFIGHAAEVVAALEPLLAKVPA